MNAPAEARPAAIPAELKTRAERAGWSITPSAAGYVVSRWGMSRTLADLPAVEAFISRATGVKP